MHGALILCGLNRYSEFPNTYACYTHPTIRNCNDPLLWFLGKNSEMFSYEWKKMNFHCPIINIVPYEMEMYVFMLHILGYLYISGRNTFPTSSIYLVMGYSTTITINNKITLINSFSQHTSITTDIYIL